MGGGRGGGGSGKSLRVDLTSGECCKPSAIGVWSGAPAIERSIFVGTSYLTPLCIHHTHTAKQTAPTGLTCFKRAINGTL